MSTQVSDADLIEPRRLIDQVPGSGSLTLRTSYTQPGHVAGTAYPIADLLADLAAAIVKVTELVAGAQARETKLLGYERDLAAMGRLIAAANSLGAPR